MQPRSTHLPTDCSSRAAFELIRQKAARPLTILCLSPAWCGLEFHFVSGSSVVCRGNAECNICRDRGDAPRWRGYVWGRHTTGSQALVICEFSAGCAELFQQRIYSHETLRGHTFTLYRRTSKPNSAQLCRWDTIIQSDAYLPPEPDLVSALVRVFKASHDVIRLGMAPRLSREERGTMSEELAEKLKQKTGRST